MKMNSKVTLIIFGQFVSQLGSSLTGFAFGILLFKMNQRVTDIGLLYFFQVLPALFVTLPAGYIVDLWSKKKLIISCDVISILALVFLLFKTYHHSLDRFDLYTYVAICSTFGSLQALALTALVAIKVDPTERAKFNTLLSLRMVIPRLVGPLFSGFWIAHGSINVLLVIDIISSCFAISMTMQIPEEYVKHISIKKNNTIVFFRDYISTLKYLSYRPQLFWSMSCLMFSIISLCLMGVYIIPMALQQTSTEIAGRIIAIGGLGAILAGWTVATVPKSKVKLESFIPLSLAFQGLVVILGSLSRHIEIMAFVLFIYYFINPWQGGCSYALWENTTDKIMYGKVLAIKGFLLQIISCLTFLISGPLADKLLDPFMLTQGYHGAHWLLTFLYGAGKGKGMALALGASGLIQCLFGIQIYSRRCLYVSKPVKTNLSKIMETKSL